MGFIWECMILSIKVGFGAFFWTLGIILFIGFIGAIIYLATKEL